jgi:hypothetical protein
MVSIKFSAVHIWRTLWVHWDFTRCLWTKCHVSQYTASHSTGPSRVICLGIFLPNLSRQMHSNSKSVKKISCATLHCTTFQGPSRVFVLVYSYQIHHDKCIQTQSLWRKYHVPHYTAPHSRGLLPADRNPVILVCLGIFLPIHYDKCFRD